MIRPALAALAVALLPVSLAQAEELSYSVMANGEIVGSLKADTRGASTIVDYYVDNNGRGPKHQEQITLDDKGIPVSWTIHGTSLMGGSVDEAWRWSDGEGSWQSQADSGKADGKNTPLYIANDSSPWAAGIYARAALADDDQSVPVLPSGSVSVVKLQDTTIGDMPVGVYRLDGIDLGSQLLMLDGDGDLFATFSATGITIRTGYEENAPEILTLGADLEAARMRDMQASLGHRIEVPVRIRNVRIFDPVAKTLSGPSTIITHRGRITQILKGDGGPVPADEASVDGKGGTVYPGLFDMHSHASLGRGAYYLAAGVTSVRDMGNKNDVLLDLREDIDAGLLPGPRIVPAGMIEGRSPYSVRTGIVADSLEDGLEAVRWYADRGYIQIKIYNSMPPDWIKPLADEAHRLGLRVSGHVPAFVHPEDVIRYGYQDIAHLNQLMLGWLLEEGEDTRSPLRLTALARGGKLDLSTEKVQHTVDMMKEYGVAQDTTAVIIERLMLSRAGEIGPGDEAYLSHMPIGYQRYRKRTFVPLDEPGADEAYQAGFDKVLEVLAMLHDNGIQLLPGTDDGTGFTVQRELELYVKAGLSPVDTLSLATIEAARYLGIDDETGSITPGKSADLVLVAGDPTTDITAIREPLLVMKGAYLYYPTEIYDALGIEPFTTPPALTLPAAANDKD